MKIVVVTGASTGIGQAAALRLARRGFQVYAGVRKEADAKTWKNVANAKPIRLDVTDPDSVHEAVAALSKEFSRAVEVNLINNAGIAVAGPIEAVSIERWREQFDVNVFGLVRVTQACLPYIRATSGRIVNISSVAGLATSPFLGPYSASKFAVEAISDALRRELRPSGCRVVVIEPGPIATPIWEKNLAKKDLLWEGVSKELEKAYGAGLASFLKSAEKSARDAVSVDRVSDAIEKALTAENPRTRYVVGAKVLPTAMAITGLLPDKWIDKIVARELS
jgi:NAD(P)-dependent dehydrogenase (short-subunit alcohol dehydrogenase family)